LGVKIPSFMEVVRASGVLFSCEGFWVAGSIVWRIRDVEEEDDG
jgi:hypothetical protein